MQFDRKFLLIAPTIVLCFVVAGLLYTALEMHLAAAGAESFAVRSEFIGAVERGEKTLSPQQSAKLLRLGLQVEEKRTDALIANRDTLIVLSLITLAACVTLVAGIRLVPREHWPRVSFGRKPTE